MQTRVVFLVCLTVAFAGYVDSGKIVGSMTAAPEFRITPPPPDLAPRVAALSGIWEATQTGIGPSRVVVERIDEAWASVLQFWPDQPAEHAKGDWKRVSARVSPNGELRWGYPVKFTLRVTEDGTTLESKVERAGATVTTMLRKVGAS
jgi:hypothetical protein